MSSAVDGDFEWEEEVAQTAESIASGHIKALEDAPFNAGDMPRLMSIGELVAENAHLRECRHHGSQTSADKRPLADSAPSTANPSAKFLSNAIRTVDRTAVQIAQSQVDPWQSAAYLEARDKLAVPQFYPKLGVTSQQLTQDQLVQLLLTKQLTLPVMEADLESALMVAAGSFDGRVYPACARDKECIGHQRSYYLRNQTGGVTWTSLMFEHEWQEFLRSGAFTGERRMCILCHRAYLPMFVSRRRLLRMRGGGSEPQCVAEPEREHLQAYYNLVDEPGGYWAQYVYVPEAGDPMTQPIVRLNCSTCKVYRRANGQLAVDQRQLLFSAAPTDLVSPAVGENVGSF